MLILLLMFTTSLHLICQQHVRHAHWVRTDVAKVSAYHGCLIHQRVCARCLHGLPDCACFFSCILPQALLKAKHLTCLSVSHLTDVNLADCICKLHRLRELHIEQSCVSVGPKGLQQLTALKQLTALRVDAVYKAGRGCWSFWQSSGSNDHEADVAMRPLHISNKVGGALLLICH